MTDSYVALTKDLQTHLATLRKELPDVLQGFTSLAQAANKEGALDKKTKELIAMALAVANRCPGCIGFHAQTLVRLNTSQAELMETLGMAIYMGGGPSLMYAAEAVKAFGEFSTPA